jgi:hypothetical protein
MKTISFTAKKSETRESADTQTFTIFFNKKQAAYGPAFFTHEMGKQNGLGNWEQ